MTMSTTDLRLEPEFHTLDDATRALSRWGHIFRDRRDRRGVFAAAYAAIARDIKLRIAEGWFRDGAWIGRYAVAFANQYRAALWAYDRHDYDAVPKCWRLSFELSAGGTGLLIQDLMLAICAHVNHDLPLAAASIGIDPREDRYQDHTAVNVVLQAATDRIKDQICELYAPALSVLDYAFNRLEERMASFSFARARQAAWVHAASLTNARSDEERAAAAGRVDEQAALLCKIILDVTHLPPWVVEAARRLEGISPWWSYVTLRHADEGAGRAAPIVDEPLAAHTLDEVIGGLEDTVARYDARGSKMALYPATYLLALERARETGALARCEDGEWSAGLELHYATRYVRALDLWEAGQPERLPRCWAMAFQSAAEGHATAWQTLLLALNARLNYDLAIALLRAGIDDDAIDKRRRDVELMHRVSAEEFKPVQNLLAAHYGTVFKVTETVCQHLEETVASFSYARALDAAWENGLTLCRASSEEERAAMVREIDAKAAVLAQRILRDGHAAPASPVAVLRHVEGAFDGRWSEWVREHGRG